MKIGTREIGPGQPCAIIAELSNNHNGDRDRCGRLIDAAQAAGADIIKLQCYTVDELVALRGDGPAPEPWGAQGYTMRTLYEKARTPLEWFPKIAAHCERVGIPWFSSVFGAESLACLEAAGCPAYKISHFERKADWLVRAAWDTDKPVLVSSPEPYNVPPVGDDYLVYCPGGYPASAHDMRLPWFPRNYIGLSSHCRDRLVAPVAVARGAKYLEYHFHLEAEPSELESNVSLNEREFRAMVDSVRRAEVLLG